MRIKEKGGGTYQGSPEAIVAAMYAAGGRFVADMTRDAWLEWRIDRANEFFGTDVRVTTDPAKWLQVMVNFGLLEVL